MDDREPAKRSGVMNDFERAWDEYLTAKMNVYYYEERIKHLKALQEAHQGHCKSFKDICDKLESGKNCGLSLALELEKLARTEEAEKAHDPEPIMSLLVAAQNIVLKELKEAREIDAVVNLSFTDDAQPLTTKLAGTARLPGDDSLYGNWSVVIDLAEPLSDIIKQDVYCAYIKFLSDNAPIEKLVPGFEFQIYRERILVAKATVINL